MGFFDRIFGRKNKMAEPFKPEFSGDKQAGIANVGSGVDQEIATRDRARALGIEGAEERDTQDLQLEIDIKEAEAHGLTIEALIDQAYEAGIPQEDIENLSVNQLVERIASIKNESVGKDQPPLNNQNIEPGSETFKVAYGEAFPEVVVTEIGRANRLLAEGHTPLQYHVGFENGTTGHLDRGIVDELYEVIAKREEE